MLTGCSTLHKALSAVFQAPPSSNLKIQLKFVDAFGLYENPTTSSCCHWVEIRYKGSIDTTGPR